MEEMGQNLALIQDEIGYKEKLLRHINSNIAADRKISKEIPEYVPIQARHLKDKSQEIKAQLSFWFFLLSSSL